MCAGDTNSSWVSSHSCSSPHTQLLPGVGDRRDCMVVGFTTTYAISAYHHFSWEFESHCCRCVLDTTLSMTCGMSVVSSTNKTDRYDMTEILLKVVLNTVTPHCYIRVYIMDDYFKQQILCPTISFPFNDFIFHQPIDFTYCYLWYKEGQFFCQRIMSCHHLESVFFYHWTNYYRPFVLNHP